MTFLAADCAFALPALRARRWRRSSPRPAPAQELSGKPIRLIVGPLRRRRHRRDGAPGRTEDEREPAHHRLVENKVGGNFIPALRELTSAAADGHTLFFISTSALITQPLHPDYPFDLTKLTPVTQVATGPLILVARNDLGIKSVRELIDHANKNPDKLQFGVGGGTGSSLYLATELLKARTGIKVTIVPYRGRGARAQRSPRRAHRCDVRCHAGHGHAGQGRQGHAAGGDQHQALIRLARRADHSGGRRATTRLPAGSESWRRPTRRRRSSSACATRWRRRWRRPTWSTQLDGQGMVPVASQPDAWRAYLQSELDDLYEDHQGLEYPAGMKHVVSRPVDRPFRRQFPVVECDPHHQGHGALRRGRAGGDRSRLRAA